jgi:hypothetical protein
MVQMYLGLKNGPFVPHNLIPVQGSPFTLLKFQMAPRLTVLLSLDPRKRSPDIRTCLSEAQASHLHRKWVKVSSSAPHLYKGLLARPFK